MSGMFQIAGSAATTEGFKLTTTDPTVVAGSADERTEVLWLQCTEISGNTPALTIEVYDGTDSFYLRYQFAMTAKERVLIDQGFALEKNQFLRVTAGAANQIDVVVETTLEKQSHV
jgi:hypothetical protein